MIHHVSLEVRPEDAGAEVSFWALLGFAEVALPSSLGDDRSRWVERSGQQIHLMFAAEPAVPVEAHVAVVAPDYAGAQERLRAVGHPVDDRPEHWGSPRCFTRTPAGHKVEVMAAPPAPAA